MGGSGQKSICIPGKEVNRGTHEVEPLLAKWPLYSWAVGWPAGSILHVADRPQEMPQLLKARAVWDRPCRDRGRLGVTSLLLASPAGPPHPHLEPGARAARQEVRGACRKPQEELRLQPAPPPPAGPWGPWKQGAQQTAHAQPLFSSPRQTPITCHTPPWNMRPHSIQKCFRISDGVSKGPAAPPYTHLAAGMLALARSPWPESPFLFQPRASSQFEHPIC